MSVTAFRFDAKNGALKQIQSIPTLPAGYEGKGQSTAELVMHPSGKFLYGSNRGHDSIVAFAVHPQTGELTLVGHTSTEGKTPRGLGVDPSGKWAFAGNQGSDSIVQFRIDQNTGALTPTGARFELGAPVCFQFLELKYWKSGRRRTSQFCDLTVLFGGVTPLWACRSAELRRMNCPVKLLSPVLLASSPAVTSGAHAHAIRSPRVNVSFT
jgi:hypothetical protein